MTRPYHHGNLREALVDAAVELARTGGAEAVVLREVSRRTGVSHNAAYRHFTDREELLAEVGRRAMAQLAAAMEDRLRRVRGGDPGTRARRRLRAVGAEYVDFALAEPGLFSVAFAGPAAGGHGVPGVGDGPYGILNRSLDELVAAGELDPDLRPRTEVACWAAVHGFAVLVLHGPLRGLPEAERRRALTRALDVVDRGLTPA